MVNTGIRMTNIGQFLKVFVIDAEKDEVGMIDMPNTLNDMRKTTGSNCVEIGDITIFGQPFKAIYSSKVNSGQHVSCADEKGKVVYRGNVIIVGVEKDSYGNEILADLTTDDYNLLIANVGLMFIHNKDKDTAYNAYVLCNVTELKEGEGEE